MFGKFDFFKKSKFILKNYMDFHFIKFIKFKDTYIFSIIGIMFIVSFYLNTIVISLKTNFIIQTKLIIIF
jgi:hypothetical protein